MALATFSLSLSPWLSPFNIFFCYLSSKFRTLFQIFVQRFSLLSCPVARFDSCSCHRQLSSAQASGIIVRSFHQFVSWSGGRSVGGLIRSKRACLLASKICSCLVCALSLLSKCSTSPSLSLSLSTFFSLAKFQFQVHSASKFKNVCSPA